MPMQEPSAPSRMPSTAKGLKVCTETLRVLVLDDGRVNEAAVLAMERLCHVLQARQNGLAWKACVVTLTILWVSGLLSTGFGVIGLLAYFINPQESSVWQWALPLAGGLAGFGASKGLSFLALAEAQRSELQQALVPLANDSDKCQEALNLLRKHPLAVALRDRVVFRGEQLRQFHLERMRLFDRTQDEDTRAEQQRQVCQELHLLSPR